MSRRPTPRTIPDDERRARLIARHHLACDAPDVVSAVRALTALHSSDPLTPYLALWARLPGFTTEALGAELYEARSLVRMHAMRRTLFVVPSDEAAMFEAAAARDVLRAERKRLEKWLATEPSIGPKRAKRWLADAEEALANALADGVVKKTKDLSKLVPALAQEVTAGSGRWQQRVAMSSRIPFLVALQGRIARSRPAGSWRSSQYAWVAAPPFEPVDPETARGELVHRYLAGHGPATTADVCWWTGWTKRYTAAALAACGAIEVPITEGSAWVLAGDTGRVRREPTSAAAEVALLPGLDPSIMGFAEREWYLGAHGKRLFDRNGNAGPSVWVGGKVVGGWAQRADGEIVTAHFEDLGAELSAAIDERAAALREWLGVPTIPRFRTPLERELSA